jgi:hypothetical protein
MTLTTEEIQNILEASSEALSETALTLEEIRLRINILHNVMSGNETTQDSYANLTRHILGKQFYEKQDFQF